MKNTDQILEAARAVLPAADLVKLERVVKNYQILCDWKEQFLDREQYNFWASMATYFEEEMKSLYGNFPEPIKRDFISDEELAGWKK